MEKVGVLLLVLAVMAISFAAAVLFVAWSIKVSSQGRQDSGHRPPHRIPEPIGIDDVCWLTEEGKARELRKEFLRTNEAIANHCKS